MGTADVVPGVSGGTMAFILGIYNDLLEAIKSFDQSWLKAVFSFNVKQSLSKPHFGFLIPLFIGICCALLFFTRVISLPGLLISHPQEVYGLFFGLISGSIIILLQDMTGLNYRALIPAFTGILLGAVIFNLVPLQTPETPWFMFFAGAIAICAMILPGISGSFILLILNKYAYFFDAVGHFKISILIPFALGALTGLVIFSRLLSYLLKKYFENTVLFIIGILTASLWVIWPFQERSYEVIAGESRLVGSQPVIPSELASSEIISILLIITGFLVVFAINWFAILRKKGLN